MKYTRKKITCWIVEDDAPFESVPVRICSSQKLAEHYVRLLSPKWEEAFGYGLRAVKFPFYIDCCEDLKVEVELIEEKGGINE